jgi:hypothetical protein
MSHTAQQKRPEGAKKAAPGDKPGRELPKELREIAQCLVEQGWAYHAGPGHPYVVPTDKQYRRIALTGSPSDVRILRNIKAAARRAGAQL